MEHQTSVPAIFIRGGTSKGLFFHDSDLPRDEGARDAVFLAAIGSPDPNGRQLDGLGGGISSLSKVMVVRPSAREDADIEYTFSQVSVGAAKVERASNCGNLTSAIGPFAVDEGLVRVEDGEVMLRLHNTNSDKIIESRFRVAGGRAAVSGDFALPGVAGTGAEIRLSFLHPGGAATGRLLPTGRPVDRLEVEGVGAIDVSMVDATTAGCFVRAGDAGLAGTESPEEIEANAAALARLEAVRRAAAVAMGLPEGAASVPKIGLVAPPAAATTLAGERLGPEDMDFSARMISMGRPHRALPLTGAMCLSVASRIPGTVVAEASVGEGERVRIAQPSGILVLGAAVEVEAAARARSVTVSRTARRLMEGRVLVERTRLAPAGEQAA